MKNSPVFLVGAERSGTTLLRLMLDSHPDIAFGEEFEYVVDQIDGSDFPDITEFHEYLHTNRVFQNSGFEIDPKLGYQALVESFLNIRHKNKGSEFVGATVHFDFEKLPLIFPDAKYVHIVRDPRDVAASVMNMGWAFRAEDGVLPWIDAHRSWGLLKSTLDEGRWISIRYEDLISNHVATLKGVCDFIGVEYTEQMYSYSTETDYDIPDPTIGSRWEDTMSAEDAAAIDRATIRLLGQYGYEESGYKWSKPSFGSLLLEKLIARRAQLRFRADRYGLGVVLGSRVSRTLGLKKLERKYQAKIDAVTNANRKKSWRTEKPDGKSAR